MYIIVMFYDSQTNQRNSRSVIARGLVYYIKIRVVPIDFVIIIVIVRIDIYSAIYFVVIRLAYQHSFTKCS